MLVSVVRAAISGNRGSPAGWIAALIFAANLRATMSATARRDSTDMGPRFVSVRSHDARSRQRSALVLTRAGVAQMIPSHDLIGLEHGDHLHARSADAHRDEAGPGVRIKICYLVVHDVSAGLPERLACNDFPGRLAFQLE